jgi:hypothetical protein
MNRPRTLVRPAAVAGVLLLLSAAPRLHAAPDTLPASISDRDFWALTEQMSEPNGFFMSDNFTSNEMNLSSAAAVLAQRLPPGGAYLGVGPEQNFTYIAAIRPKIAFITDIRRGNLHMHLMYKALFELSDNRAEFLSRLFTKKRPAGLTEKSSAADLMNAYWDIFTSDEATYKANLQAIDDVLVNKHHFPLSQEDLNGIEYVYHAFYWNGLLISYSSRSTGNVGGFGINYANLMMATDSVTGQERSYLSTEEGFAFLKALESKNLVIPIVGDFGGPKALRAVGTYLKDHGAVVSAFYVSNVESYLKRDGKSAAFCANVATMPLDEKSTFLRPMGPPAGAVMQGGVGVNGSVSVTYLTRTATNTLGVLTPPGSPGMPVAPISFGAMAAEVAGCK